jgi:putative hydrolase of the HAD superfamily
MRRRRYDAVTLDAMGTILTLNDPAPLLRDAIGQRLGVTVSIEASHAAMRREMAYYRAAIADGSATRDPDRVAARCAAIVAETLGVAADVSGCLRDAIRYVAYEDAAATIDAVRRLGARVGVISNWNHTIHGVLADVGLAGRFDVVVTSEQACASKPQTAIYTLAAATLGVAPDRVLHAGDDPVGDVDGARNAGFAAVLVDRSSEADRRAPRVHTLTALTAMLTDD